MVCAAHLTSTQSSFPDGGAPAGGGGRLVTPRNQKSPLVLWAIFGPESVVTAGRAGSPEWPSFTMAANKEKKKLKHTLLGGGGKRFK